MSYTQADLTKLQKAISNGASELQMGGERVKFRDLDQMLKLEKRIKAELGINTTPTRRVLYPNTKTGFRS